jgi:formylglycine-generating enzyme required for sulfatase activity
MGKKRSWICAALVLSMAAAAAGGCASGYASRAESADATYGGTPASDGLVLVKGGTFRNANSNYYGGEIIIEDFYIGKYEVTQREWTAVMGYNPSRFKGDDLPVDSVSWYEAIEYCNRRSLMEGLEPYYNIDKSRRDPDNRSEIDTVKWIVTINEGANGYRLPTEQEWEYAAAGGPKSRGYKYSGGNRPDEVSWNWRNAGDRDLEGGWSWQSIENNGNRTRPVGGKKANELGIHDMSGNVREWCWDWYEDEFVEPGHFRVVRGGGWLGDIHTLEIAFRGMFEANGIGPDQGFRVARNADPGTAG